MLQGFEEAFERSQNVFKDPLNIIPSERVSLFKKSVKSALDEVFTGYCTEISTINSPPLPEMKNFGEFVNFLRSEESDDVLNLKPVKEKMTIFSFKDKCTFETAKQIAAQEMPERSTEGTNFGTLPAGIFKNGSDDFSEMVFGDSLKTPRLYTESEWDTYYEESRNHAPMDNILGNSSGEYGNNEDMFAGFSGETKLNELANFLSQVNKKQNSRNDYLKMGKLVTHPDENAEFEYQMRAEEFRDNSFQKLLFQSPRFKEV